MVKENAEMHLLWQEQRDSEEQCHDDEEHSPHNLQVKNLKQFNWKCWQLMQEVNACLCFNKKLMILEHFRA